VMLSGLFSVTLLPQVLEQQGLLGLPSSAMSARVWGRFLLPYPRASGQSYITSRFR
jgi:hypothetical protein